MVFACCFGGAEGDIDLHRKSNACAAATAEAITAKPGKGQDCGELPSGDIIKNGGAAHCGNTSSLSAVSGTNNSLNALSAALAGLSGSWYERVSLTASKLANLSGAALCAVSILEPGRSHFTVVHVTGKDPDCMAVWPIGVQLPALQAAAAHQPVPSSGSELRYNSLQILQLLQTPLPYSFSDAAHARGFQDVKQAPHDWKAMYDARGLSEFCALPLMYDNAVVGAVTLVFCSPQQLSSRKPPGTILGPNSGGLQQQQQQQQRNQGDVAATAPPGGLAEIILSCDEQLLRMLGLLLSALLAGQDLLLAQQVGDILAALYDARNLQQVVTAVAAGAERVLQLKARVSATITLAVLPEAVGSAAGLGTGSTADAGLGHHQPSQQQSLQQQQGQQQQQNQQEQQQQQSGRAIFFEEQGSASSQANFRSVPELHGSGGGGGIRARMQRAMTPLEAHGGTAGCSGGGTASGPRQANPIATSASSLVRSTGSVIAPGLRGVNSAGCATHDGVLGVSSSRGALLWQSTCVQARALGLRHTLLANLPSNGTIVLDCASHMQQVGFPKRDLYLLSTCRGSPPVALAIAPAPLRESDGSQLVLYAAVGTRLPVELLTEILSQTQQLALHVLAPAMAQKLEQSWLADEWALLLGRGPTGRGGGGSGNNAGDLAAEAEAMAAAPGGGAAGAAGRGGGGGSSGSSCGGGGGRAKSGSTVGSILCVSRSDDAAAAAAGASGAASQPSAAATNGQGVAAAAPPLNGTQASSSSRGGGGVASSSPADATAGPRRVLSNVLTSHGSQTTVLSTALVGAFAGDTRTQMGMLVSSFKETINALQANRLDEAEELSVLKLGKVLGRGGSGLVFQGYLHMGLEVAVKLFENPDDTDPDAVSSDNSAPNVVLSMEGSSNGPAAAPEAAAAAGGAGSAASTSPHGTMTAPGGGAAPDGGAGGAGAGSRDGGGGAAATRRSASKTAAAQMTKRQRDLLRNALELGVTSSLSHPNIVQGYCHWVNVVLMQDASLNRCWLMGQTEYMALAPPGSPPPPLCSALVMEYCDMGSLIHALKRGTFSTTEAKPNMEYLYMCLLEIALALRHLHTAKIAHCDLKPGNVLLRSSPRDPRGFVCKLADFGYAAILKDGLLPGRPAVLPDEACGTLQYMAPELFVAGRPVDASIDIYAFGMLMCELITGRTPYSESEYPSRALMKAVYHGKRPVFPESVLAAYKNLAMCCWSGDPSLRPTATVLVKLLRQQLEAVKHHASNTSSSSTVGSRV